jgi:septin 7
VHALQSRAPFAVIGSNAVVEKTGAGAQRTKVRARVYPWGVVEGGCAHGSTVLIISLLCPVENLEHNDYVALRDILIRTHLWDMIDVTNSVHYENYRVRQLMVKAGMKSVTHAKR